jgi:SAM-dependent methyltransferase
MTAAAGAPTAPASFRDPAGTLFDVGQRVLRRVHASHAAAFDAIASGPVVGELVRSGRAVSVTRIAAETVPERYRAADAAYYEHERIPFIGYPCEWSPAMLADAADFTLALALDLLKHRLILKDATPANILHRGCRPVLVDIPSIVDWPRGSFVWLARQQFESCFLLPLIAASEVGLPLAWSLADPVNGITHQALATMLGARRWLKPSLVSAVGLPAALSSRRAVAGAPARAARRYDERKALFILEWSFEKLRSRIQSLAARVRRNDSNWRAYTETRAHYGADDIQTKRRFVADVLASGSPEWVLDVGANTGEFSELAARRANVVAIDIDEVSIDRIFENARRQSLAVLPLVVNLARPTPAAGWQNAETRSFVERATGRFDAVMMLAVVHHLRITGGVPLAAILDLAGDICRGTLIIEFVPVADPMFGQLARGREEIYTDWTREEFERLLLQRFVIERTVGLTNHRVLYCARKRS